MLFFDIDGVLRDLGLAVLGHEEETYGPFGSFGKLVATMPHVLVEAPKTQYADAFIDIAKQRGTMHLISAQPDDWRERTTRWISINLPASQTIYVYHGRDKLKILERIEAQTGKPCYIVEDYPNFDDYSRVIVVARKYNRCVLDRFTPPYVVDSIESAKNLDGWLKERGM